MSKQRPDAAQNTWADIAHAVEGWQIEMGVSISAHLMWRGNLSTGGYVEVVIYEDDTVGRGAELVRVREAFPAKKMTGQPGAVLWAISCAIRALECEPWQWSRKMRRRLSTTP